MAGRLLLEQHCQRTSTKLIYPALAVYRHYYELQLKYLVGVAHRVLETPIPKTRGHDLIRLLPPIEEAITRVWGSDESEAFGPARLCAEFLTMIDPVGESMRYSSGRRGSTVQEATFLDPPRLIAMLEEGANLMDAADMGLNVWIDDRAEAR